MSGARVTPTRKPWEKSAADRERDKATYGDPEYRKNRRAALKRAGGRCELLLDNGHRCGSRDRVQVDHIIPVSQHGTHHLDNLRVLCKPHHAEKTAQEGKGYRKQGRGRGKRIEEDPPLAARTKW